MLSLLHNAYGCIKFLVVFLYSKLHFRSKVNYKFSQWTKLLNLVQNITFSFYSYDCLYILYFTLVRYKPLSFGILMSTKWNLSSRILQPSVLIVSFLMSITVMLMLYNIWSCTTYIRGSIALMHSFFFSCTLVLNSVFFFWKWLVLSSCSVHRGRFFVQCLLSM
jgi:hypothetical protein